MLNPQPRPGANTPRTFLHTLFWTLPLHVLAAIVVVGGAAILYSTSLSGHGVWALVGGWSLTALYVVIALVAGTLAGALDAAGRTVERLELGLRTGFIPYPKRERQAKQQDEPFRPFNRNTAASLINMSQRPVSTCDSPAGWKS